jgi:hypothetical protein
MIKHIQRKVESTRTLPAARSFYAGSAVAAEAFETVQESEWWPAEFASPPETRKRYRSAAAATRMNR